MLAQRLLAIKKQQASEYKSLKQVITSLGLTAGLKICADAGDAASYNPAVQTNKWFDVSGNGYDFNRGSGTGSDAADPAFNGSAGALSASEYWSVDGGDYFSYDSPNEAWMSNLHKDGALFSALFIVYFGALGTDASLIGTNANSLLATGIGFRKNAANQLRLVVSNASGTTALSINSTATAGANAWNCACVTVNEASAAGAFVLNSVENTFSATYNNPSSGNATRDLQLGAAGNATNPLPNGSRLACAAVWEGVALTSAQLSSICNQVKGRFGL